MAAVSRAVGAAIAFFHTGPGKSVAKGIVEGALGKRYDGEVTVGELDYALGGDVEIKDLVIAEHGGRKVVHLKHLLVQLDWGSLFSKPLTIEKLAVNGLDLDLVSFPDGTNNLRRMQKEPTKLPEQIGNEVFLACFGDNVQAAAGAEFVKGKLAGKNVYLLRDNSTEYTTLLAKYFEDAFTHDGGTIIGKDDYKSGDKSFTAQITKIKATGADTLFLTTAVEQITLVMKQAQEQRLGRKIITTGGSSSPTQLIKQAGAAAEGSYHIVFFMPWFPEAMPDGKLAKAFVDEWAKRGHPFEGLTEGFRGHDGIATIAEAIKVAGKDEPKAVRDALWKVSLMGVNGPIKFEKDGPAGKESGQSQPSIFVVQIRDGKWVPVE